jgi:hypothetical protein
MKSIIAANHPPIQPELETLMKDRMKSTQFPTYLGLVLEEVRRDYARMRLPYRPELDQAVLVTDSTELAINVNTPQELEKELA